MLASISPLGERARRQSYPITVFAFIATSTIAASLLGGLLGLIGAPISSAVGLVIIGAGALAGLLLDLNAFGWRIPGPHRQVNEDWLVRYRGWVYGAGFGAQLGVGVTTIVVASMTWLALGCALSAGSVVGGAIIGGTFGFARALPILATARVYDAASLRRLMGLLDHARRPATGATLVLQAAIGLSALGVVAGRMA
jgi:hypothetical protein